MNSGVGVEPVGADHDLALVGDMGDDPGDELQIVHPHKKRQDLPAEDLGQPPIVPPRKPVENPRPVDTALARQEMQVRVEVDPVPEGLDSDNDAGDVEISTHDLAHDRPEIAIFPLEKPLVFGDETVKMVEQHPV